MGSEAFGSLRKESSTKFVLCVLMMGRERGLQICDGNCGFKVNVTSLRWVDKFLLKLCICILQLD